MADGDIQEEENKKGPYDGVSEDERYANDAIPLLEQAFEQWGDLQGRFMNNAPFGSAEAAQILTYIGTLREAARKNVPPAQAMKNMRDIETYVAPPFGIAVSSMIERLIEEHSSRSAAGVAEEFEEFVGDFDSLVERAVQEGNQVLQQELSLGQLLKGLETENG